MWASTRGVPLSVPPAARAAAGASSWVREAQLKATWRRGVDGPPVLSQTLRRSAAVPRPHGVPSTWTA